MASGMTLVAPVLGTPASGNLANCTFPTLNQNTTGSAGSVAAANVTVGTFASGMTLVAPVLGTPASGTLTNCTSIPASHLTGAVPAASDVNGLHNFSSSSLTPGGAAGTYYYLSPSTLTMPATYTTPIAAGTVLKWQVYMSKTAAGTGAFNIGIYMGTNGTTADTREVTQSVGTATAALDDLTLEIIVAFTSTTAFYWSITTLHSAASAVGFGCTIGSQKFSGTVTGLTTTTASLKFGIGYSNTTGTAVITVPFVQAEALGVS